MNFVIPVFGLFQIPWPTPQLGHHECADPKYYQHHGCVNTCDLSPNLLVDSQFLLGRYK
jgi:hypothetical protein